MKIELTKTSQITHLNGVPVRVWEGKTEKGVEIVAFIARIAVQKDKDCSELENELTETDCPKPKQSWPMSMVL